MKCQGFFLILLFFVVYGVFDVFLADRSFFVGILQKKLVFPMKVIILRDSLFCGPLVRVA